MASKRITALITLTLAVALLLALAAPAAQAAGTGAPKGLKVAPPDSSVGGYLELTWRTDDASEVRSYRVYRSESKTSGFKVVYALPVNMEGAGMLNYVDGGLEGGRTYYYKVSHAGDGNRTLGTTDVAKGVAPQAQSGSAGYKGKRIVISIADQRAYFLEDEVLIKSHLVSTGTTSHPTPEGLFSILYHEYCAVSVKYGGVYCYWWMGFYPDTGMHALPYDPKSGTWTSASCLGTRASHGCVRQAVADAEWAYKWAPNGTRLDIIAQHFEPPPPPPPDPDPIKGGHGSQGMSKPSKQWYFAEGCTSGWFDEYILMMNPNHENAYIEAEFMKPDGSVTKGNYVVQPLSRYTIHVDDIDGLEDTEVSTKLSSDQLIVSERSMYFEWNGKLGGSDSAGVSEPSTVWYLAEGYTGGDFDEFILVQNPQDRPASISIRYMLADGRNVNQSFEMDPHSRHSVHVDDIEALSNAEVSAKVTADVPVVVERAQYFNYYGRDDGNTSTGIVKPSETWYFAEGYTGGDFDEYVLLQNPNDEPARAKVTFMCEDGRRVVKNYYLRQRSRFTIHVDDILADAQVSTQVECDREIIAERSMYFVSYGRPGGADAPGVAEPGLHWYLPEGYTGGEFDTYVLLFNPNDERVHVDINFLCPGGKMVPKTCELAPGSRYTIHVDAIEDLTNTEVSTAITGSAPIVCERAMYFTVPRKAKR